MTAPAPDTSSNQQQEQFFLDPGNPFMAEYPAGLTTRAVNTPGGQRLAVTLRVGSATVTAFLAKDDVARWRDQLGAEHGRMNGLLLPGS